MAGFLVGGCSSTPDWANPAEWYRDTKDWVSGTPSSNAQRSQASTPIPGKGKIFPELSSVPARPLAPNQAELKNMTKSLAADRKAARYSDEKIRRQRANVAAADAPAQVSRAASPVVAPKAMPTPVAPAKAMNFDKMPRPVFRQAPSDIVMRGQPIAIARSVPVARSQQNFVQAQKFSTRFPAGAGTVSALAHSGVNNKVATIKFETGAAKLTSGALRKIREAVAVFKQRGGRIHVIGHASSRTRDLSPQRHHLANIQVSYDRANAIARELRRLGVAATAIRISAVSDSQPAFLEVMPAGEAGNRRAVIVLEN